MRLIIDIPEEVKHNVSAYGLSLCPRDKEQLVHAIVNGTPLDDLRAEIEQTADEEQKYDKKWAIGLRYAVKIIDKYRGESKDVEDALAIIEAARAIIEADTESEEV